MWLFASTNGAMQRKHDFSNAEEKRIKKKPHMIYMYE
jgi:hypothetical protein